MSKKRQVCLYFCFRIQDLNFLSATVSCNDCFACWSLVCEMNSVQNLVLFGFRSSNWEWLLNTDMDLWWAAIKWTMSLPFLKFSFIQPTLAISSRQWAMHGPQVMWGNLAVIMGQLPLQLDALSVTTCVTFSGLTATICLIISLAMKSLDLSSPDVSVLSRKTSPFVQTKI